MNMKRSLFFALILSFISVGLYGNATLPRSASEIKYRRNSVYSIVVNHLDQEFAKDIFNEFSHIPVPEKFNDHNLSVVGIGVKGNGMHKAQIDEFIVRNKIASRMVAKWFNRDSRTGVCDMELIKARGLYNASEFDKEFAQHTARGAAILQDAGEDLISNTFLLVNEVTYVDKNKGAKVAAGALTVLGALAGMALGVMGAVTSGRPNPNTVNLATTAGFAVGAAAGALVATYKGFSVRITTSLYQLEWNDELAGIFYSQHYTTVPDPVKRNQFEKDRDMFKLRYIGKVISRGSNTSFLGINEDYPQMMVRKACQRAIDENIVDLQREYEQFRVKSPIMSVSPNLVIPIGKKEGITKDSKYEVLEARSNGDHIEYVRVGVIEPVPDQIWDNRFMAIEERAPGALLGQTTFRQVSGKNFMPGMLVRELI